MKIHIPIIRISYKWHLLEDRPGPSILQPNPALKALEKSPVQRKKNYAITIHIHTIIISDQSCIKRSTRDNNSSAESNFEGAGVTCEMGRSVSIKMHIAIIIISYQCHVLEDQPATSIL